MRDQQLAASAPVKVVSTVVALQEAAVFTAAAPVVVDKQ
jgi:hypothetical protein